jgi:hypothetical protein
LKNKLYDIVNIYKRKKIIGYGIRELKTDQVLIIYPKDKFINAVNLHNQLENHGYGFQGFTPAYMLNG